MPPRKCRTKAARVAKDAQVVDQPESPCLPPHDQEEPTDPVDQPLTNEEEETKGGACATNGEHLVFVGLGKSAAYFRNHMINCCLTAPKRIGE
ncbi:hypothetical protein DPMN_022098 [Dreissena polymorpha]|uniref:Uncharacterized protein n=1 Tax=Dreissena polymorpha TaxID=45954 RepID=A0A9D4SC95_DREPO|nr:hypothetical protein DPMN_022098 [Dreissena polymorpha]